MAKFTVLQRACANSAWQYMNHVCTYDNQGGEAVRPFPMNYIYLKRYLYAIRFVNGIPVNSVVVVPKSRRTMASWSTMADCTHLALFREYSLIIVQSQKEDKAKELVNGRCGFILDHLPKYILPCDYEVKRLEIIFGNGSKIMGVPQGVDQVVQYGPTRFVQDEVTIQEDGAAAYAAIAPALQDGGQYIGMGTPRGQSDATAMWFWEMCGKVHWEGEELVWEGKPCP